MHRWSLVAAIVLIPASLAAQTQVSRAAPDGVVFTYVRFADIFGSQLVSAFDSIPAARYDYRPMPAQQTVGFIAQHLENANYSLCERLGDAKRPAAVRSSLADTLKARWPKDTLVARLRASLDFCNAALERLPAVSTPALTATLLGFETDLAEHYSQIAVYMRMLNLVPPSALPPPKRTAITLPSAALAPFVGVYALPGGIEIEVTTRDAGLFVRSNVGGEPLRLWPETATKFFVNEVDAQITFTRDASGSATGLTLHQYGRDRLGKRIR
ncbi:MAG TPA: DUF3471 domain-containing protein [Gemmatimonadaceae bacterium]|nr:DUF3471 domain-containing protein [Gemmatimonadaceae bacterium]